jgi:hypothetical protein
VTIEAPRRRSKRWLRRILLLLALALLGIGVAATVRIWTDHGRLTLAIAEADRHDPGWRLADIDAARDPYPPAEQNASLHLLTIRLLLGKRRWPTWPFPQFDGDPPYLALVREAMDKSLDVDHGGAELLDAEQERVLRVELKVAEKALVQARRLVDFPGGRYPLKWSKDFNVVLPHVDAARFTVTMLHHDGLLRAHDGDSAGALQDVRAIMHVARALGDEPFMVTQGVRLWTDRALAQFLERMLALGGFDEVALCELQNQLNREAELPIFLVAMRGERAFVDALLESAHQGEIPFRDLTKVVAALRRSPSSSTLGWNIDLARDTLRFYASIRGLRAAMLERGNAHVKIAQLPAKEQLQALEALGTDPLPENTLSLHFMSISSQGYTKNLLTNDLRHKARFRSAQAALAAERFRLAHERWPVNLEELVPAYLAAVPEDPFNGERLRFARKPWGLVIYSVGQDLIDNGGTLTTPEGEPDEPDVGFILYDPDKRRQAARPFPFPPREPNVVKPQQ